MNRLTSLIFRWRARLLMRHLRKEIARMKQQLATSDK